MKVCRVLYSRNVTIETSQHLSIRWCGIMSARSDLSQTNSPHVLTGQLFPRPTSMTPMVTTVRSDYRPPPSGLSRAKAIHPPVPASVLHKDACFINMQGSLTQSTYRYHSFFSFSLNSPKMPKTIEWDTWACQSWIPNSGSQHFHYSSLMLQAF